MVFDWVFERQERSGGMREKKTRRFFAMDQNRRGRLRRANVGGSDDWNLASAQKRKGTRESPSRDGSEGRRASSTRAAPRASRRVSPPLGFGRVCISSRARARAHLLLASRWFSAAFACPPPPAPRWRFPRGTTEGHFSCVAAPAARFPLPRFRAATARAGAESPRTVPSPRGTAADTRSVPESATARRGSAREGERMSGDAGNKFAVGETGNAKARVRFPATRGATYRLQRAGDRVSVGLARWVAPNPVGDDAQGCRSRQQVVIPQQHLRLRVHRVHARFGVFLDSVRRFPVK